MSELSFAVVEVPKTTHGRAAAPNPYAPAVTALLELEKGQALQFKPLEDSHTDKLIMRRMRAVAPENVTLRSKFDAETKTMTVWYTEKKPKPVPVTETENAAESAPETETAPATESAPETETAPEAEKPAPKPRAKRS